MGHQRFPPSYTCILCPDRNVLANSTPAIASLWQSKRYVLAEQGRDTAKPAEHSDSGQLAAEVGPTCSSWARRRERIARGFGGGEPRGSKSCSSASTPVVDGRESSLQTPHQAPEALIASTPMEKAIVAIVITRKNPKSGKTERPYRDRRGNFVLGDPAFGNKLHHRKNAVVTTDYDEALRLVRKGFSIRMSAGDGTPPSLISAGKLRLIEVDEVAEGAIPPEAPHTPFTREAVMRDLQKALIAEAAMIARWGSYGAAEVFLGFPSSDDGGEPYGDADPAEVDLSRFRATPLIEAGYDWAFQIGNPEAFGPAFLHDLGSLVSGASAGSISPMSPMGDPDSDLRVTIDTALARWKLEFEPRLPLSVRELAYLAQMTEVAARNALAKAGLKGRGGIDNDTARQWLAQRQKFVPTRASLLPSDRP